MHGKHMGTGKHMFCSLDSNMAECQPSESSSDSDVPESRVVSLLDKLKSPEPSALSRKRKVLSNHPPLGKKRSTGTRGKNDPSVQGKSS